MKNKNCALLILLMVTSCFVIYDFINFKSGTNEITKTHSNTKSTSLKEKSKIISDELRDGRKVPTKYRINITISSTNKGLLDLDNFNYLISNNPCDGLYISKYNITTILVVTSNAGNDAGRSAIRRAYPKYELEKLGFVRLFSLAQSKPNVENKVTQKDLYAENRKYRDIVQGNFYENYRNLTYKHVMGLKWAVTKCNNLKYIIKMDDDVVIDLYRIKAYMNVRNIDNREMAGYIFQDMRVGRNVHDKFYVTYEEYNEPMYPQYLSGAAFLVSVPLARDLVNAANMVPYFWIDDVFVTGILANQLNVSFIDLNEFYLLKLKVVQNYLNLGLNWGLFVVHSFGNYSLQNIYYDHCKKCRTSVNACDNTMENFTLFRQVMLV